jgi:hypothetical protein
MEVLEGLQEGDQRRAVDFHLVSLFLVLDALAFCPLLHHLVCM